MKKQLGPSDTFFPVPPALVVSGTVDTPNIMTVAWIGIVSSTPASVGISLKRSRHSLELIRRSGEFTVNIPSSELFREVDYCGIVSGRKRDKFADTGLHALPGLQVSASIIQECPYNMECRVLQEVELGDWVLVIGEIVETHIDEDKADPAARAGIDISKVDPLVFCARVREYWSIGEKLGKALHAGKGLLESANRNDEDG